jgi:CheY-like chemotaxis protein
MQTVKFKGGTPSRRTTGSSRAILEVVSSPKARVLLVEDDPQLMSALQRVLRGSYDVTTASSGMAARNHLAQGKFSAIVLDLVVPGVSGCELLTYARDIAPDTVRILISGDVNLEAITTAINDGQLYRFLQKPFAPSSLLHAVEDSVKEHRRLLTARELLERTEAASVGALVDLLAITQPGSFGRPARLRAIAENLARELGVRDTATLGIAAQLSLVGHIIVPRETFVRAQCQVPLSLSEEALLQRVLPFVERLVETIPRFEQVCAIIRLQYNPESTVDSKTVQLASILRTSIAFEALENAGLGPTSALSRLEQSRQHDEYLLDALGWSTGTRTRPRGPAYSTMRSIDAPRPNAPSAIEVAPDIRPSPAVPVDEGVDIMPLADVTKGMQFADDVIAAGGVVLIARGQIVSHGLVDRIASAWSSFANTMYVRMVRPNNAGECRGTFERVV